MEFTRYPSKYDMSNLSEALSAIKKKCIDDNGTPEEADLYNAVKSVLADLAKINIPELRDKNDYDIYCYNPPVWVSNKIVRIFETDFNDIDPRSEEEKRMWYNHIQKDIEFWDKVDLEDYIYFENENNGINP